MQENKLNELRHSLSHLLASAVLELYPDALPSIGPAIDNGFYYDFDFPTKKPGDSDLFVIEKLMKKKICDWKSFEKIDIDESGAKEKFTHNPYKLELIEEIVSKGESLTLYSSGDFTDLCRGGHFDNLSKIDSDSFRLQRVAGAYWRGDEKNKMLTRIYGLAFASKEELLAYDRQIEEAKARDHKKLGKELDLFTFSELVGPGLPLWTPKGTLLRNTLDDYIWSMRKKAGYMKVEIPHITKKELYQKSGHWDKFNTELFNITTREKHQFAMKPMNCPHHTQIYSRKLWSYREMPQRYANTTMCYRDEQTGELSGLSRLRSFTQDDAHVFCREIQITDEFLKIWDIVHTFYSEFGFDLKIRLSLHDPNQPDKYLGDKEKWAKAEGMLRKIVEDKGAKFTEGIGEAAFYGPKLDFMAEDSIGREWQVATIQLDMNMPERFDLYCINEKGEQERIFMIHAAIMGSIERFLSVLIEHTAGNFPTWLSPVQVKIIPISEEQNESANVIYSKLKEHDYRIELDDSNENLGKKIRLAKTEKIPYLLVIGKKEVEASTVNVESRDTGQIGMKTVDEFISILNDEIRH
jgi:threonyl-tRNA synthetase